MFVAHGRPAGCRVFVVMVGLLAAGGAGAQSPPAGAPPAPAASGDLQKDLAQLQEQIARLDPKAPDYPARLKAVLQDLVRANQALARENAALRQQVAGGSRPPRAGAAAPKAPAGPVVLFAKKGLTKYHRTGCRVGDTIDPETRVSFANPAAAEAAGLVACKICHPESFTPTAPTTAPPNPR